mmetsp:Transcript_85820/g.156380  ORF Transcript_85820/g.156380 Transcript_85820/m.156380 type:complete len:244 (+) Transcript_85820:86-817(+)
MCPRPAMKPELGLDALKERQRREAEERQAKRDAARARRLSESAKRDADERAALVACEARARKESEENAGIVYEAALVVYIACTFGPNAAWTKIAEACARGANIPLEPRRIYLLVHPDKCHLPEASDATAILNAQRPPAIIELPVGPAPMPPSDPEAQLKHQEYLARQKARAERLQKRKDIAASQAAAPADSSVPMPAFASARGCGAAAGNAEKAQRIDPEAHTWPLQAHLQEECKPQRRVKRW